MLQARCGCGALTVDLPGPSEVIVACHCIDCQRRSGSPFGVGAYYPADAIRIAGDAKEFVRPTATGGKFRSYFCPTCGSTVYWKADKHPTMIGVAVGAIASPDYPGPVRSVWEQSRHQWVEIATAGQHFARGREA